MRVARSVGLNFFTRAAVYSDIWSARLVALIGQIRDQPEPEQSGEYNAQDNTPQGPPVALFLFFDVGLGCGHGYPDPIQLGGAGRTIATRASWS